MSVFNYDILKDPEIFQENRLAPHADYQPYPSYAAYEQGENPYRLTLNGLWKFAYAQNYNCSIKGFEREDYDCGGWNSIRVPAHIQLEGYDVPQYVNYQYPWDGREELESGRTPELFNPVASYIKYFEMPKAWKGMSVCLSFQGAESALALWCNGKYVGYSEDTFTPSEFDLTPYLKEKENKLAVQVYKWCSASWCEDQDFYRFSGLFRDVYLYAVPKVHVKDLQVRTILEPDYRSARLLVDCNIQGRGSVKFVLKEKDKVCAEEIQEIRDLVTFTVTVQNPKLWSCEIPFLYLLCIEIYDEEGELREIIPQKIGFREITICNSILKLNGKRLVFHGVNRHEFSTLNGRCISREETLQDILTIKRNNINAIRASHYPNASFFYELCDEYGLYVIDENNLESQGSWEMVKSGLEEPQKLIPGDRTEYKEMLLDRIRSMYHRDKNHPCIIMWSLGNESFAGTNLKAIYQLMKQLDNTRPVHYEGVSFDTRYPEITDVHSEMYPPVSHIREYLKTHRDKPFLCCEYAHAMGNSCGALFKYTEYAYEEPLYAGGFIWDYIDQSITAKDRYGKKYQSYGGDFKERPSDYNFCGNGIVYANGRTPSPKMQEVKYCYQFIHVSVDEENAEIENRYLFTDLSTFSCIVTLNRNGLEIDRKEITLSVAPLQKKTFTLPLEKKELPGEYTITVSFQLKKDTAFAGQGYEIAFGQGIYKVRQRQNQITEPLSLIQGAMNTGVKGRHFDVLFSRIPGGLSSYRFGKKELLEEIPLPNFWRPPTDNDNGNDMKRRYAQWKIGSMYITAKGPDQPGMPDSCSSNPIIIKTDHQVQALYRYYMPTNPASQCQVSYKVSGDVFVEVNLSYDPVKELHDMPEFGMIFRLDADYDNFIWYGNGPEENYEDRKSGAKLGIYSIKAADNMAGYLIPQECGNRTGIRWAKVLDDKGHGIQFETDEEMSVSVLPFSPHEIENARHSYDLPAIHHTVIRVSQAQMGIGGDNSWGAETHPEFLIDVSQKKEFHFRFKGI